MDAIQRVENPANSVAELLIGAVVREGEVCFILFISICGVIISIQVAPEVHAEASIGNGHGWLDDNGIIAQFKATPDILAQNGNRGIG
jgi:hypothetical protein